VPDEQTSGQVVQLGLAVLAVAARDSGNTGSTLVKNVRNIHAK
jgi:hypothetical protein